MCGICGILHLDGRPVQRDILERMNAALRHRGPDDQGYYFSNGPGPCIGLGFSRLAIIDLATGQQPLCNEDRSLWLVGNGEIYNFKTLQTQLRAQGHSLRTASDIEVLLHLYENDAQHWLDQVVGMYALALWDSRERRLVLARDRLGQKPLFYHQSRHSLIFASELAALLEYPCPRRVNPTALSHYLTFGVIPAPDTILQEVRKLPPAHILSLSSQGPRQQRYWQLQPDNHIASLGPTVQRQRLRQALTQAVRWRQHADVPVGAFLSGGIDSSIVVGLMAHNSRVRTFSIGYQEKAYNELNYARLVARYHQTQHHEQLIVADACDILPRLVVHFGEPFADSSALATYYVARATRQYVKVALTGDGADEIFAGYPRHQAAWWAAQADPWLPRRLFSSLPRLSRLLAPWAQGKSALSKLQRLIQGLPFDPATRYLVWSAIFTPWHRQQLLNPGLCKRLQTLPEERYREQWQALTPQWGTGLQSLLVLDTLTYLPNDLLVKVDITTMACGLEARCPFLDHQLLALAHALPLHARRGKTMLKQTFADLLPPPILTRGKMGFGVPVGTWLNRGLSSWLQEVLLDPATLQRPYFQRRVIKQLVHEHLQGRVDHGARLWTLMMFELWHRHFL